MSAPSRGNGPRKRTPARTTGAAAKDKSAADVPATGAALEAYSDKRAFDITPEPGPVPVLDRAGPLLFVVQQHAARRMHWDFRLEWDGVLKSWAVPKAPSLNPTDKRLAVHVEDHPFDYAAFEGVIPDKQYGAGQVIVWDCGVYSPDEDQQYWFHDRERAQRELRAGYEKGKLSIFLRGEKLKGSFALVRTADPKNWFLIKHRDRFAGNCGTGFDDATLRNVKARCDAVRAAKRPFAQKPAVPNIAAWLQPELVAEVEYLLWTVDRRLRAPVFKRLRDDVDPQTLRGPLAPAKAPPARRSEAPQDPPIEEVLSQLDTKKAHIELSVGSDRIKITNLDRVYWPAEPSLEQPDLTKRDLLRYFACISRLILPHLADRPLTMIRMPEGIHGERFYQKHWEHTLPPFVQSVNIYSESKDERQDYLMCNNLASLLWLAQVGTLELHVWHSRVKPSADCATQSTDFSSSLEALESSVLNYPDYLVFDIDPYIYSGKEAPGAEPELNTIAFEKGKQVAFWLRELLLGMSLTPIVKTSGKTGLHVFVPIERTLTFDAARHMCEAVGRHLMAQHPQDITMDWAVKKRTGKIFMDYNMNVRAKTLNVAYSPRGAAGAPMSMPLTWGELEKAHPLDYRLPNVIDRLRRGGDVWKDALLRKHSLEKILKQAAA